MYDGDIRKHLKTNETSKNDSSKLASQITGNCDDDPKEEFRSHFDEDRGRYQLKFGDRFK